MKEMTASEYFREKKRLTGNCRIGCINCPLSKDNNQETLSCFDLEYDCLDVAISIVQKWAEENPKKTMLQDFLEKFPKAELDTDGVPCICPCKLGYVDTNHCDSYWKCKECWNRPLEAE